MTADTHVTACSHDLRAGSRQRVALVEDREKFLEELCAASPLVAHIGCVDAPYTEARLKAGSLLHSRLVQRGHVVGFDVDAASLQILARELPQAEFACLDISKSVPPPHGRRYDLVIAGEVLEHVGDPAAFLAGCGKLLRPGGRLCVTVPNACSPKIGLRSLVGRESVHPDHRVYYGPRTLKHTLESSGFVVEFLATYFAAQPSRVGSLVNRGLRLSHRLFAGPVGEGLIVIAHEHEGP